MSCALRLALHTDGGTVCCHFKCDTTLVLVLLNEDLRLEPIVKKCAVTRRLTALRNKIARIRIAPVAPESSLANKQICQTAFPRKPHFNKAKADWEQTQ